MNKNLFHVVTGQNLFTLVPYFKIYLFSFIRRPSHRLFLFGGRMKYLTGFCVNTCLGSKSAKLEEH